MLGATRPNVKTGITLPEETEEERQHRFATLQSQKLASIVNEISGHLGHWSHPSQSHESLGVGGPNRYEPALRFGEAVADLKRMLVPVEGSGEASEEVARLIEMGGMVHKHLAPLLVVIPVPRHFASALNLIEMFIVLTDEHPRWEYAEDHFHSRQVLKKVFSHVRVQERLLALLVHCVSSKSLGGGERDSALGRIFAFIRNVLAVPDGVESFKTGNGMSMADVGKTSHVLRSMAESKILEFLLVAAGSAEVPMFMPHCVILCEIFALVFGSFSPAQIAAGPGGATKALTDDLEADEKRPIKRPIRHSNFSGSIVFKLSTGQDYILRQGSHFNGALDLDKGKKSVRQGGRKQAALSYTEFGGRAVCSQADIGMISGLAKEFLASAFNVLMRHLLGEELPSRLNDDRFHRNVLRLATWFLIFVRKSLGDPLVKVNESVKLASIYSVLDVDSLLSYSRLLHRFHGEAKTNGDLLLTCVVFFRETLRTLELLPPSLAGDIQNALFYRMDLLQRFRLILQGAQRPTVQALTILVETVHVLLKLLERFCSGSASVFVGTTSTRKKTIAGSDQEDDSDSDSERLVEKRFEFQEYLAEFACEPVLLPYTALLLCAPSNPPSINRYLAVMFYRLHQSNPGLFHKAYFLDAAHRFLRGHPSVLKANAGLQRVLRGAVEGFFRALRDDPVLIVEALFPYCPASAVISYESKSRDSDSEEEISVAPLVELPEGLGREQKIRTLVRRLVDQEMVPHLHWLASLLASNSGDGDSDEHVAIVAESDSQKRALRLPAFSSLLLLLGFKPPTAMVKHWHLPPTTDKSRLGGDAEYVRQVAQDAVNEASEEGLAVFRKRPSVGRDAREAAGEDESESEDCPDGTSEVDSEVASDFDLSSPADDVAPVQVPKQSYSKFQERFRSGFFNAGTAEGGALPLQIQDQTDDDRSDVDQAGHGDHGVEEEAVAERTEKRAKVRVLDSDDDE